MSRAYRPEISEVERDHLQQLLAADEPFAYRAAMQRLGADLGRRVALEVPAQGACLVVCTVEDADFLVRGFLEGLGSRVSPGRVALNCFWNERRRLGDVEVAPIVRRYVEPGDEHGTTLIVIKSIISGACVVRTNLMEVLERHAPARIFVVAPVIHADAERKLEREFSAATARRFEYVWLARDDVREADGTIRPGIGGSVYDLLGLGGETAKNRHYPRLIHERRAARRAAPSQ